MDAQLAAADSDFRAVTPAEIAHYQQFGWVKLDRFIPIDKVNALLAMARARMGERGDRNLPPGTRRTSRQICDYGRMT